MAAEEPNRDSIGSKEVEVFEHHPLCAQNGHVNAAFYDPELPYYSEKPPNPDKPCEEQDKTIKFSKFRVYKNMVVLGVGFMLLFTAYKCLVNLQSSLNHTLGTMSLSAVYVAFSLSCVFLPSFAINLFGLKHTLTISVGLYILYFLANFHAEWYTLGPASVLAGIAAGPLWTAEGAYLTTLAGHYAEQVNLPLEACLGRIIGGFYLIYLTCQIWGNLISYYVLKPEEFTEFNETSDLSMCGAAFCNKWTNDSRLELKPTTHKLYMLYGIYTMCVVLATLLIVFMLDPLQDNVDPKKVKKKKPSFMKTLMTTLKHITNPYQLLLIPLTLYSGLEQAYIAGDFTKAFVSCGWGVHHVGYVMICYGLADAVFSFVLGHLMKLLGRVVIFSLGMAINISMICLMFWWHPSWDNHVLYFVIAGLWGVGDAVWQTAINAIYGVLFFDAKVAAFANLRLWKSIGFMIAFAYSSFLCVTVKLAVLSGFLVVGMGAYLAIEIHLHMSKRQNRNSQCNRPTQETAIK